MRPQFLLAVTAVAGLGLSACGGDDGEKQKSPQRKAAAPSRPATLDTTKVESQLRKVLSVPTFTPVPGQGGKPGRTRVRSLTCPQKIERRRGKTFACKAKVIDRSVVPGGFKQSGTVTVTQLDDLGHKVRYRAKLRGKGLTTTIKGKLKLR